MGLLAWSVFCNQNQAELHQLGGLISLLIRHGGQRPGSWRQIPAVISLLSPETANVLIGRANEKFAIRKSCFP